MRLQILRVGPPDFVRVMRGWYSITEQGDDCEEPRITVEAEYPPELLLLDIRISKDDEFQKQQGIHDIPIGAIPY